MSFHIRPAQRQDAPAIRALVRQVRINPSSLDWQRFWLAVDDDDRIIGCGQVKPHADGTRELASIAVRPEWRGQGIARALIERLLANNPPPLYLTCRARLEALYGRFGFIPVPPAELPLYFRRIWRVYRVVHWLFREGQGLLVMRLG